MKLTIAANKVQALLPFQGKGKYLKHSLQSLPLSPEAMNSLFSHYNSPVQGSLPKEWRSDPSISPKEVLKSIDWMAEVIRLFMPEKFTKKIEGSIGRMHFSAEQIGKGEHGKVFKFKIGWKEFVIKFYKNPDIIGPHGPIGEGRLDLLFSAVPTNNVAKYLIGNVHSWAMKEKIEPNTTTEKRDGITVELLCKLLNLHLGDQYREINIISSDPLARREKRQHNWNACGKIMLDSGYIIPSKPKTVQEFKNQIQHQSIRYKAHKWILGNNEKDLLPLNERWKALQSLLTFRDTWALSEEHFQDLQEIGIENPKQAFNEALKSSEGEIAAAWLMKFLETNEDKYLAAKAILNKASISPKAKELMASRIPLIEESEKQWEIFQRIFEEDNPIAKKIASHYIDDLDINLIEKAFDLAIEKGNTESRASAINYFYLLNFQGQKEKFKTIFANYIDCRSALMKQLHIFNQKDVKELIDFCWQYPDSKGDIAANLGKTRLKEIEKIEIFQQIFEELRQAKKPNAIKKALSGIKNFSKKSRTEIFKLAIQYKPCQQFLLERLHLMDERDFEILLPIYLEDFPNQRKEIASNLGKIKPTKELIEFCLQYDECRESAIKSIRNIRKSNEEKVSFCKSLLKFNPELKSLIYREIAEILQDSEHQRLQWGQKHLKEILESGPENLRIERIENIRPWMSPSFFKDFLKKLNIE